MSTRIKAMMITCSELPRIDIKPSFAQGVEVRDDIPISNGAAVIPNVLNVSHKCFVASFVHFFLLFNGCVCLFATKLRASCIELYLVRLVFIMEVLIATTGVSCKNFLWS